MIPGKEMEVPPLIMPTFVAPAKPTARKRIDTFQLVVAAKQKVSLVAIVGSTRLKESSKATS
jgi:hypothetical protein